MIILGIDPGTATTGFGVIEAKNNTYTCIDFGCITTSKHLMLPDRLLEIGTDLDELIKTYNPDYAGVEEVFFHKNVTTAIQVSHARGVVIEHLASKKIPTFGYTPLQVKQSLTGYGKANKQQVQEMVKSLLKLKNIPRPDDAADGLAIALTHAFTNRFSDLR